MENQAAFVYSDRLSRHVLSKDHPMKPARLRYTYELLSSYGAFNPYNSNIVDPRNATTDEILMFHSREYVEALSLTAQGLPVSGLNKFNLGQGDNPVYEGIYDASTWSTGATLKSVDLLIDGVASVVYSISGGLHHAMPNYASGFCVFNDPVLAIKQLMSHGMRVVYIDLDCHHGDGVQYAFYDTDLVLTISMHESGAFLFPGTGYVQDTGRRKGKGYSVNLPLYPYTSDEVYLWAFREIVPPLLNAFRPDIIVTQLGIDSHYLDPITHIALTVQGFEQIVKEIADLSPGKWLALGGGGYDVQAVARAWTLAYGVMSGQEFSNLIPPSYNGHYGVRNLRDPSDLPIQAEVTNKTRIFAEQSVRDLKRLIFPIHGISLL